MNAQSKIHGCRVGRNFGFAVQRGIKGIPKGRPLKQQSFVPQDLQYPRRLRKVLAKMIVVVMLVRRNLSLAHVRMPIPGSVV